MIIYLIYLIEEHTFTPPRKSEFRYPLVYRQNKLTKIDQSNCAIAVEGRTKWPILGKNNLKIRKTQGLIYKRKFSKKLSSRGG